jgi:hypothetical protein
MENIIVIEEKVILPETPLCEQTVTIPCIKGDKGDKGDKGECFCKDFFQIGVF